MNDNRSSDPTGTAPGVPNDAHAAGPAPAVAFTGRTPRKSAAVRAGIVLGTGLLLAIGAAVAMGASPAPSGSTGGAGGGSGSDLVPGVAPGGPGHDGWAFGGRGHGKGHAFGQISVTAVSGSSISLATDDGWTRTITVTDATTITRAGAAATLSDITVGDAVRFAQTRNDDGTFTITAINIVLPHVMGTVTATTADTITISRRDGTTVTVHVGADTTIGVAGDASATIADIAVGMVAFAEGAERADGSIDAATIRAGDLMRGHGHGKGHLGDQPDASAAPDSTGSSQG